MPGSRNIVNSGDAIFDETFHSAIATTLKQHKDSLALQPLFSFIPDATTTLEHTSTGTLTDNNVDIEEGEKNAANDHLHTSDIFEEREEFEEGEIHNDPEFYSAPIEIDSNDSTRGTTAPLIVDDSNTDSNAGPRRTTRRHKPNPKYANVARLWDGRILART